MANLLILSAAPGYGGAERSMEILLAHAPAHDRITVVAESQLHLAELHRIARPNIEIVSISSGDPESFNRAVVALIALVLRVRPKAVLANTKHSALLLATAAPALRHFGTRFWLYVRDFLWEEMAAILAHLPDARVMVPSEVVLERPGYLAGYIGPEPSVRVTILPDMVDLPSAPADPLPELPPRFLHLATVNGWKGHVHLLRALAHARDAGTPVRCRSFGYVGDTSVMAGIEATRTTLRLDGAFHFGGYIADPRPEIRASTAVVVTSVSHSGGPETFCRAIIEAWACGRAVVAFDAGAPSRIVTDGETGLLVPEGDEHALAAALVRLAGDPALARRWGVAGRQTVERFYEASAVAARFWATLAEESAS